MTEALATDIYNLIFAVGCIVVFAIGVIAGGQR